MKKWGFLILLIIYGQANAQLNKLKKKGDKKLNSISLPGNRSSLSDEDITNGLKEALIQGISIGSDKASAIDGYFKNPNIKIPFPPEARQMETRVRQMGLEEEADRFIESLNRGAEKAAQEAKPIFINAIREMTIQDGYSILRGEDDEATQYLNRTTSKQLNDKFQPIIKRSLDEVNATKYYTDLVTTYNRIPFVNKMNPNLDEYATEKAIDGLFYLIAQEEKKIREDPLARTSDLLRRVFGR